MIKDLETVIALALDEDARRNNHSISNKDVVVKQMYDKFYLEIEKEVTESYSKSMEEKILKEFRNKRISDYIKLAWSGLFLALIVGLLVNQLTELIGFMKAYYITGFTAFCSTVFFTVLFLLFSLFIFALGFSQSLKEFINNMNKKTRL